MEDLIKTVDEALRESFPGAVTELELVPPLDKVTGFIYWDGFEGKEQLDRQGLVWKALRKELNKPQQRRVSAIFTLTPEEASLMRSR